jgi:hypothetical protein
LYFGFGVRRLHDVLCFTLGVSLPRRHKTPAATLLKATSAAYEINFRPKVSSGGAGSAGAAGSSTAGSGSDSAASSRDLLDPLAHAPAADSPLASLHHS